METVRIPLYSRHGEVKAYALLDADDAERLGGHTWRALRSLSGKLYGVRYSTAMRMVLHREVLRLPRTSDGREVDHVNLDTLDDRKSNLRIVSHAQNMQNRPSHRGSTSQYRGVHWETRKRRWLAKAHLSGVEHFIGYFANEEDAARAAASWRAEHMPFATA